MLVAESDWGEVVGDLKPPCIIPQAKKGMHLFCVIKDTWYTIKIDRLLKV